MKIGLKWFHNDKFVVAMTLCNWLRLKSVVSASVFKFQRHFSYVCGPSLRLPKKRSEPKLTLSQWSKLDMDEILGNWTRTWKNSSDPDLFLQKRIGIECFQYTQHLKIVWRQKAGWFYITSSGPDGILCRWPRTWTCLKLCVVLIIMWNILTELCVVVIFMRMIFTESCCSKKGFSGFMTCKQNNYELDCSLFSSLI